MSVIKTRKEYMDAFYKASSMFYDSKYNKISLFESKTGNPRLKLHTKVYNFAKSKFVENKNTEILRVKNKESIYILDKINNTYYITREIAGDTHDIYTKTTVLTNKDLKMFKDLDNITAKELKKLGNKLEIEEGRFGI